MAAYLGYTLRMKTLFRGWPVMARHAYEKKCKKGKMTYKKNKNLTTTKKLNLKHKGSKPQQGGWECCGSCQVERRGKSSPFPWRNSSCVSTNTDNHLDPDRNVTWRCHPTVSTHGASRYLNLWKTYTQTHPQLHVSHFILSASLYFSKRGAYLDRLCRDIVGRWLSRACTVAKWCILDL